MSKTFKKEKRGLKDHGRRILQERVRREDAEKAVRDALLLPVKHHHMGKGGGNENS